MSQSEETTVYTHYFVGGGAGDGGASLLQEGLQEAHQWRDVAGALPERRLQQVGEQGHVGGGDGAGVDLQQQGHHLEDVGQELCGRSSRRRRETTCGPAAGPGPVGPLTLHVVLQDLGEDGEERFLEAADGGSVGLAGDADGQTQRLEQVVVEVRLAGVLK